MFTTPFILSCQIFTLSYTVVTANAVLKFSKIRKENAVVESFDFQEFSKRAEELRLAVERLCEMRPVVFTDGGGVLQEMLYDSVSYDSEEDRIFVMLREKPPEKHPML